MAEPTPEAYEVNQRLALLCVDDTDRKTEVSAVLQELDYRVHVPAEPADALERMRRHPYDIVMVDETFHGATPLDHPLLAAIQAMPMSQRRSMFVALIGGSFTTFDNTIAFARSVNVVVNTSDLEHLKAILERAVAENDEAYRVLRQVLQESGKH
jgi:CheY-like chemotaxis protein